MQKDKLLTKGHGMSQINLSQQIASRLSERIVRGELAAGTRLLEIQLADELAVSRGPIREALRQLAQWRLVDILPRRGVLVTTLTTRTANELYDVVIPLYELLTRETCRHWTPERLPPVYTTIEKLKGYARANDTAGYYESQFAFARACCTIIENTLLAELLRDFEPGLRRIYHRSRCLRDAAMADHLELMRQLIRHVTDRESESAVRRVREIGELERELALKSFGKC